MASQTCLNCMYVCCDPEVWLRCLAVGEPLVPKCANHPLWPGWLRDVPGVPCRNYRAKLVEPPGDVRRIPLGHGQYALVDAADYEWLSQWNWRLHGGYAMRYEGGKRIFMHRQIMRVPEGRVVDHMDGNRANNCRRNLRICNRQENACNAPKRTGGSSQFKGVSLHRQTGKWCASIESKGRRIYLGLFVDEVEAARAYDRAAVERFGVFARPNFPEDWPLERRQEVHAQWLKANGGHKGAKAKAKRAGKPGGKGRRATAVRATRRKAQAATSKTPARRGRKCATVSGGSARRR
jgi:hypothetical protein